MVWVIEHSESTALMGRAPPFMAQPDRTGQPIVQEDLLFAVVRAMNWERRKDEALERGGEGFRPAGSLGSENVSPQFRSYRARAVAVVFQSR